MTKIFYVLISMIVSQTSFASNVAMSGLNPETSSVLARSKHLCGRNSDNRCVNKSFGAVCSPVNGDTSKPPRPGRCIQTDVDSHGHRECSCL